MTIKRRVQIILTFIILIALMAGSSCSSLEAIGIVKQRPNVILILTDDLDFPLMPYLEQTNQLIQDQGATFTNYYVTAPLCCPSRASTFRGQYPHNTNILENSPGYKNYYRNGREEESIAVWLSRAGYKTALMGKYLNGYPIEAGESYVPPGWTDWHAYFHHDPEDDEGGYYFDYQMNENGKVVEYGSAPEDYSTDVIKRDSINFINNSIAGHDPFFLYISLTAPHGPSIPAPRHAGLLTDIEYPHKPSFLTDDITPKPYIVMNKATVPGEEFDMYDANFYFRNRAGTLLAVDEMVQEIVQTLEQSGQIDNTYIIFTSDNGFHMGEHNFSGGKGMPYIEDVNVPFFIRGPGIEPGTTIHQMTANIDLAPTILDMAGGKTADFVDGRSMMPLWGQEGTPAWRNGLLIEAGYTNRDSKALIFRSVRTETTFYVEFVDGTVEYYDLAADPYERENTVGSLDAGTLSNLHTWLDKLKTCAADACRQAEMEAPVVNH